MVQEKCRIGTRSVGLLGALIFATLPGCMCFRSSCSSVTQACLEKCGAAPRCCRGNVHVFLVNGFDPFDIAGTGDLRSTLNRLGFTKVYSGQFYHAAGFADEIEGLAAADPNARFVVVGIGAGVDAAVSLAETVAEYGVTIELLASVDSPFWSSAADKKPFNVQRILSVHGRTNSWLPTTPGLEEDITLPVESWLGVISHPVTVDKLAMELAAVADTVPPTVEETPPSPDEAPVPRKTTANIANQRHVVSYLDPTATLEGRDPARGSVPAIPVRPESGY